MIDQAAVADLAARALRARALLNEQVDSIDGPCACASCADRVAEYLDQPCHLCGYRGAFVPIRCQCFDDGCVCAGRAGGGCPHGMLACPVCDDGEGEVSPWDIVKRVRSILDGEDAR